jgi:WD40 repeat protein
LGYPGGENWEEIYSVDSTIRTIDVACTGEILAVGCDDGKLHFCALANVDKAQVLEGHANSIICVKFESEGRKLVITLLYFLMLNSTYFYRLRLILKGQ